VILEITNVELTNAKLYPNTAFSFTYSFINAGLDAQGVIGWVDLLYLSTTEDPSGTSLPPQRRNYASDTTPLTPRARQAS
jgi:hypothetical protein